MKIKTTNAAGLFYPAAKAELLKIIDGFFSKVENESRYYSRAIIVPHAGYIFSTEEELLEKITPYQDGIIIRDGEFQSVYLPDVWKDLPDKKEFMRSLKLKASLEEDYFSDTFQAFKFHTTKLMQAY